jgi:sulfur carrier protein ThiS
MKAFIGIDPDVTKSGVAYKNGKTVELYNYSFFDLFDYLKSLKLSQEKIIVYIECGFLNKSNWHTTNGSNAINAQIGQRTGANHETAKKIIEMCIYLELKYFEIKPTKSKVNADFFKQITKIDKRTNQEQRDAYMLIHGLK